MLEIFLRGSYGSAAREKRIMNLDWSRTKMTISMMTMITTMMMMMRVMMRMVMKEMRAGREIGKGAAVHLTSFSHC
jgi:hypothetical protein